MAAKKNKQQHEEYDWLNDPFDEKKIKAEQKEAMSSGTKNALTIGCLLLIMVVFGFGLFLTIQLVNVIAPGY